MFIALKHILKPLVDVTAKCKLDKIATHMVVISMVRCLKILESHGIKNSNVPGMASHGKSTKWFSQ